MDLDDLKAAWQTLSQRLDRHDALTLALLRDRKLSSLRRRLLPLRLGQMLQIVFGLAVTIAAVAFWTAFASEPRMLVTGLLMHAYGITTIAAGVLVQRRISRLDYASAVVDIQKQLASLRRTYVTTGLLVGLPWTLLWILAVIMAARVSGTDLFATAPAFVYANLAFGALLLLAAYAFRRRLADILTGPTLRRAQATLDELVRFEA
jgi:hypothetical protein